VPDEADRELELALDNTSESWKRALLIAAGDMREAGKATARRERWIIRIAVATLAVALATLVVSLLR